MKEKPYPSLITSFEDTKLTKVVCGEDFSVACGRRVRAKIEVSAEGDLYSWGSGQFGQLGNGGLADELSPQEIHCVDLKAKELASSRLRLAAEQEVYTQDFLEKMLRSEFKLYRPTIMLYATLDWSNWQATSIVSTQFCVKLDLALTAIHIYELLGDLPQSLECRLEAVRMRFGNVKQQDKHDEKVRANEIGQLFELVSTFLAKSPDELMNEQLVLQVPKKLRDPSLTTRFCNFGKPGTCPWNLFKPTSWQTLTASSLLLCAS